MSAPRFKRRKEDRPAEITAAALAAFAENGYAATRVDDVARRAGVSKGLLYLYFATKEELFRAVIRSFVVPKIDALKSDIGKSEMSATAFLRGPFLEMAKSLPNSPAKILVRLMVAEGPKHPDLTAYYLENVVAPALDALRALIAKGVASGEFRPSALDTYPQLIVAPVMFSMLWSIVFDTHHKLDSNGLIESHIELLIGAISASTQGEKT